MRAFADRLVCFALLSLAVSAPSVAADAATEPAPAARARAQMERRVVLGPDDVRLVPEAPEGFKTLRADIPHGVLDEFSYLSSVTNTRRKATVYLPPGYSTGKKYPVLYLLHGIGGDETEWLRFASPQVVLDNLIADGKAEPMILVMPNGRALADDAATGDIFSPEKVAGFAAFERDLLDCLIPAVEGNYAARTDAAGRGLAGLSMGGGQTLNFGFGHLDTFGWIGAFSSAPNTRADAELLPDPAPVREKPRLIYLSCGDQDGLMVVSQRVHALLKANAIPHLWNVDNHGHDAAHWAGNLYHFVQLIFR